MHVKSKLIASPYQRARALISESSTIHISAEYHWYSV